MTFSLVPQAANTGSPSPGYPSPAATPYLYTSPKPTLSPSPGTTPSPGSTPLTTTGTGGIQGCKGLGSAIAAPALYCSAAPNPPGDEQVTLTQVGGTYTASSRTNPFYFSNLAAGTYDVSVTGSGVGYTLCDTKNLPCHTTTPTPGNMVRVTVNNNAFDVWFHFTKPTNSTNTGNTGASSALSTQPQTNPTNTNTSSGVLVPNQKSDVAAPGSNDLNPQELPAPNTQDSGSNTGSNVSPSGVNPQIYARTQPKIVPPSNSAQPTVLSQADGCWRGLRAVWISGTYHATAGLLSGVASAVNSVDHTGSIVNAFNLLGIATDLTTASNNVDKFETPVYKGECLGKWTIVIK